MLRLLGFLCLILCLVGPSRAEVRRYRVQVIMRQGTELLDQRSFWVKDSVPRPLELKGLPLATTINLSATREMGTENVIVYFQVVAPPTAAYQELTSPRLSVNQGSSSPAFTFSLQGQVYRICVTSLKVQEID